MAYSEIKRLVDDSVKYFCDESSRFRLYHKIEGYSKETDYLLGLTTRIMAPVRVTCHFLCVGMEEYMTLKLPALDGSTVELDQL